MQRLIAIIGLEVFALFMAAAHYVGGVHTDEAKYLLNIPYPHPPLVRWFLSLFDGWMFQEFFVRALFATIVIQSVWFLWELGRDRIEKVVLSAAWLLSWGVLSQAGTVMMSPLTAVQGLVFLWLLLRGKDVTPYAGLIALFWLASLFTAYQAVLFFPLVIALFWKMRLPFWKKAAFICIPPFLLALYTLTNPFALSLMVQRTGSGETDVAVQMKAFVDLFLLAGSGMASFFGILGMGMKRSLSIVIAFFLVVLYIYLDPVSYYAVLLVPFLVIGMIPVLRFSDRAPYAVGLLIIAGAVSTLVQTSIASPRTPARATLAAIEERGREGPILIQGSFGHEWQYESSFPILKYGEWLLENAQAVVCLKADACDVRGAEEFEKMERAPVEVWVR